jgi:hypothetical protein
VDSGHGRSLKAGSVEGARSKQMTRDARIHQTVRAQKQKRPLSGPLEHLLRTATEPLLTEYKLLCILLIMKTHEQKEPDLKRYVGRVSHNGKVISGEYVDWFTDDDDARAGYREIMEEQGYKVKSVTIGNPCIVEIE